MPVIFTGSRNRILATGQLTQYSSELDDGYYRRGNVKSYAVLTTGSQSGSSNVILVHLAANTGVSFDGPSKEIRCTGGMGVFKAAGGETIVVTGSVSNNTTFTTSSATADKIVVTVAPTTEAAGASVSIAKRESISNNVVIDNGTGLMWTRYPSVKMGVAGNGITVWTGQPYDVFAFCAAANVASLGGYSDWRIPNAYELIALADYEAPTANPDSTAFPTINNNNVWTSTINPNNTANRMVMSWLAGTLSAFATTQASIGIPMLVRG